MKIGLDCSGALLGERTGVGNYSHQLIFALSRIDKVNEYVLYPFFYSIFLGSANNINLPRKDNFRIAFESTPYLLSKFLMIRAVPSFIKEKMLGDIDVVHSMNFSIPKFRTKKKKLVATIYDLTVMTHPECHRKANVDFCLKGIKDAARYADQIIAISEHTKNDLMHYMKVPEERITVTYLAAGSDYYQISDPVILNSTAKKYKLPDNYILFIGSLEPRKNIRTLLKAYSNLPNKFQKEFFLVIAGGKGWLNSDIPSLVQELNISDKVKFAGYIEKQDINAVYSQAAVFVYPSLYEGFGLPILEAMACGTPVITSNTSSMPEVAGDAARLITPTDIDELTGALEDTLKNESLRQDMRQKGLRQASLFSWEKCAKETLAVYNKVAGK